MKLQFENNEYYLMKDGEELAIATTDESFIKELGAERLCRKDCEAIKNGYDLDELAENHALEVYDKVEADEDYQDYANFNNRRNNFKEGFLKALEILSDKKFSDEDLLKAFHQNPAQTNRPFKELIQSLQQPKEIEVEIVTHVDLAATPVDSRHPDAYLGTDTGIPFLDENGCLILKKKVR